MVRPCPRRLGRQRTLAQPTLQTAKWLELSVETPREFVEPLSSIFHRYGSGGVVVEEPGGYNPDEGEAPSPDAPVTLKTYLPVNATTRSRKARIEVAMKLVGLLYPLPPLQERELQESDWAEAWKKDLRVFHVTPRLVIRPSWLQYEPRPLEAVVQIDPGMAFGTGHHPTTHACLQELDRILVTGDLVLDLGAGSGILSIAAVKLGARSVVALDIDADALKVARQNARDNKVARGIRIARGTLPHPLAPPGGFDLALANISSAATIRMAQELALVLRPGGRLIASGIVQDRAQDAAAALLQAGFIEERRVEETLWVTLVAIKGSATPPMHNNVILNEAKNPRQP
ncbi:MAG: 50S ribosomal protein L11 methyltransferase [Dehalococcoidia bacterium]|nr:50S ribosomal protein L11 methyltransferase [Dehalococcoidia bacterium]